MINSNLANRLEEGLPDEIAALLQTAGEITDHREDGLYIVGGIVRDLMLGKPNLDLDLVVEGDAVALARELAKMKQAKVTTHPRFKTATIKWDKFSVDFATARTETYDEPGALPAVTDSSIDNDLRRRDFTVNAMAICLNAARYGELIDIYGGRDDLDAHLIRVLHDKSFTDDATRIWRALRYEQRLDFQIEEHTLALLKRDIPRLDTISGSRIRYELECVFQEAAPEKIINRAGELGILEEIHPSVKWDNWLTGKYGDLRNLALSYKPSFGLYLALLFYHLSIEETEQVIAYLKLRKPVAKILRDTTNIRIRIKKLAYPELKPSYIYRQLHEYSPSAVTAAMLASSSPLARQHLNTYFHNLRYVKPFLDGDHLIRHGVTPGPRVKEILLQILEAKLDGKATTREGEEMLLSVLLKEPTPEKITLNWTDQF